MKSIATTTHPEHVPDDKIVVARRCIFCNTPYYLTISRKGFAKWQSGVLIQNALPELSPGDRELLISSTCEPCFDNAFSE